MREHHPNLNQAYVVLIQEENHIYIYGNTLPNSVEETKVFLPGNQKPLKKTWYLFYEYCKKKCHDFDHCFKRKGYSLVWKFRSK